MRLASPPRRVLATGLATLLALGVPAAVAAPSASAAARSTVTGGSAEWGLKESWRNYMGAGGTITPKNGAAFVGPAPRAPYSWPATGGSVDASSRTGTLNFRGAVTYSWPGHMIDEVTISDPSVTLTGGGKGRLELTVANRFDGGPRTVKRVTFATISGARLSVSGGSARLTTGTVAFTKAGVDSMVPPKGTEGAPSGLYNVGDPIDTVSATVTVQTVATAPKPGQTKTSAPKTSASTAAGEATSSATPSASTSASTSASKKPAKKATSSATANASGSASPSTEATAPATAEDGTAAASDDSSDSASWWLLALIAVVAIAAGGGAFAFTRRRLTS